ncbi:MAG: hypothetical protein PHP17_04940 [Candidatus Omnitrophica bacterium]|nr:hypothetical protein [Candidatus Omnitrophota bacterium]
MRKIIFIALAGLLLSFNAFAEPWPYIKVRAQLVDFEERRAVDYAVEYEEYVYAAPVAKFKIVEPIEYANEIIGVTYLPDDYDRINEFTRSIGDFYTFEVPQDYIYGNFFEIDYGYINRFQKESSHTEMFIPARVK